MFKHILVPLDGSPFAERALGAAIAVATAHHATVTLLQAINISDQLAAKPWGLAVSPVFTDQMISTALAEATSYLGAVAAKLTACGVAAVESKVVYGSPAETINAAAADCDLVVMSTHGRSGIERVLLGSVAATVVHNCVQPVLLVGSKSPIANYADCAYSFSHILVPLDGSQLAEQALPVAATMAERGSSLLLLEVVASATSSEPFTSEMGGLQGTASLHLTDNRDIAAHHYLEEAAHRHLPAHVAYHTTERGGDPATEILSAARSESCDLIVIATHARAGVERLVHGSVAERVVSNALVPVMVLRGQVSEQATDQQHLTAPSPPTSWQPAVV